MIGQVLTRYVVHHSPDWVSKRVSLLLEQLRTAENKKSAVLYYFIDIWWLYLEHLAASWFSALKLSSSWSLTCSKAGCQQFVYFERLADQAAVVLQTHQWSSLWLQQRLNWLCKHCGDYNTQVSHRSAEQTGRLHRFTLSHQLLQVLLTQQACGLTRKTFQVFGRSLIGFWLSTSEQWFKQSANIMHTTGQRRCFSSPNLHKLFQSPLRTNLHLMPRLLLLSFSPLKHIASIIHEEQRVNKSHAEQISSLSSSPFLSLRPTNCSTPTRLWSSIVYCLTDLKPVAEEVKNTERSHFIMSEYRK